MYFQFYQWLLKFSPAFIRYYLRKRAHKNPAYLEYWHERFGQPYCNPVRNAIWIHAVSVGETRAAEPLITALQHYFPQLPLLLTQMTPTGRLAAQQLFPNAQCRYLPYDKQEWVSQFLEEHQPAFGVLMETEIWPNLLHQCKKRQIPIFLANARLSERSKQGYEYITSLIQPALATLSACFAQTQADAERLASLGTPQPMVLGNTKYDISASTESIALAQQFTQWIGHRSVFIAASTRTFRNQDEARLILQAWKQQYHGDALLILVPRHPENFQVAYETAKQLGLSIQKRSSNQPVLPETQVWLGDSMGELFAYYQAADIAFVGGSLVDTGCQNIIEPLSCGKPVLFGESIYNFQAACEGALKAGAAQQVFSATELVQMVNQWFNQPSQYAHFAEAARQFITRHQGASKNIAAEIAKRVS